MRRLRTGVPGVTEPVSSHEGRLNIGSLSIDGYDSIFKNKRINKYTHWIFMVDSVLNVTSLQGYCGK